jgi:hypothetical protein
VSDCWLPELDQSRRAAVLTAAPVKPLVLWRVLERYGRLDRLENDWYGFGAPGEENRRGFLGWLQTTRCDTLVYIDQTPGLPPDALTECVLHSQLRDLLPGQHVFRLVKSEDFPEQGCRVTVWARAREAVSEKKP